MRAAFVATEKEPAVCWEVITCAEIWGVDLATRRTLYGLPVRTFESVREMADLLSG